MSAIEELEKLAKRIVDANTDELEPLDIANHIRALLPLLRTEERDGKRERLKIVKRDDGYWLLISGEPSAFIFLGIHGPIVMEAIEKACSLETIAVVDRC